MQNVVTGMSSNRTGLSGPSEQLWRKKLENVQINAPLFISVRESKGHVNTVNTEYLSIQGSINRYASNV